MLVLGIFPPESLRWFICVLALLSWHRREKKIKLRSQQTLNITVEETTHKPLFPLLRYSFYWKVCFGLNREFHMEESHVLPIGENFSGSKHTGFSSTACSQCTWALRCSRHLRGAVGTRWGCSPHKPLPNAVSLSMSPQEQQVNRVYIVLSLSTLCAHTDLFYLLALICITSFFQTSKHSV